MQQINIEISELIIEKDIIGDKLFYIILLNNEIPDNFMCITEYSNFMRFPRIEYLINLINFENIFLNEINKPTFDWPEAVELVEQMATAIICPAIKKV